MLINICFKKLIYFLELNRQKPEAVMCIRADTFVIDMKPSLTLCIFPILNKLILNSNSSQIKITQIKLNQSLRL